MELVETGYRHRQPVEELVEILQLVAQIGIVVLQVFDDPAVCAGWCQKPRYKLG